MYFKQNIIKIIQSLLLLSITVCNADCTFGYIDYTTRNVGDDIQSIAAKQFLSDNRIPINREYVGTPLLQDGQPIPTLMNGWFMHTKNAGWPFPGVIPPDQSWPPSSSLDPLLISFHISRSFVPEALSDEGIRYFKDHGPVGARDLWTFEELSKRDIPCYFSGCLTLTLQNIESERDNIIYAVDLDQDAVRFIEAQANCPVERIGHIMDPETCENKYRRLAYARSLLKKYQRARCVITSRLHAAMPCLAFKTPVLLVNTQPDQYRFKGLKELTHNCSREELLKNKCHFDFNHPPENPPQYLTLRENLQRTVSAWVRKAEIKEKEKNSEFIPSLHVLIPTIGRTSLFSMLESLQPQLMPQDYLTVIFDGQDQGSIYEQVKEYLSTFTCSCFLRMEPQNLGFWGHGIRNKYNRLKGDFILHGDDDDAYAENALDTIRKLCVHKQTLYIFTMKCPGGKIIGKKPAIRLGNIGTPMGVVPGAYNAQSVWLNKHGGDFSYYNVLQHIVPRVEFIDQVIYFIKPHSSLSPMY